MNEKDLLAILNKITANNHGHIDFFSDAQLKRAYTILRINVLLKEHPDAAIFECRPTPAPQAEQPLFIDLEPGAFFHRVGETRTLEKLAPAEAKQALFCPFRNCPPKEVKFNAIVDLGLLHVCPDTPVVEVPF